MDFQQHSDVPMQSWQRLPSNARVQQGMGTGHSRVGANGFLLQVAHGSVTQAGADDVCR